MRAVPHLVDYQDVQPASRALKSIINHAERLNSRRAPAPQRQMYLQHIHQPMSDCFFQTELSEWGIRIDPQLIEKRMHELEGIIRFEFRDIRNLANAMCCIKIDRPDAGKNSKDYYNDSLATVGDAVIKTILSDALFKKGQFKGDITTHKSMLEDNDTFYDLSNDLGIYRYSFNRDYFYSDAPGNIRLPNSKHNQYFEAIAGAIFYDSGFEACKKWLLDNYYQQLL